MTQVVSSPAAGARRESDSRMQALFPQLTDKQHQVLAMVSENHTSKEIAYTLGISESAVNQRIEGVRNRLGFPPRAELARAYRQYQQDLEAACKPVTGENTQVPDEPLVLQSKPQDVTADSLALADAMTFQVNAPWQDSGFRIVPEVLDGANAGLNRTVVMIAIAGGLLVVAMVGLGVAQASTTVF